MGQKINPSGLRIGVIKDWDARWYAEKDYADIVGEDLAVRKYINKQLDEASVGRVEIERAANKVNVNIHTARPGMVIGRGGQEVDSLRRHLDDLTGKSVHINVVEIKEPELNAKLVARNICEQLENRIAFRRAMRQAVTRTMQLDDAQGIKVQIAGRLNGADIARIETQTEGTVPLHTLRADIDYALEEADTQYGIIGVKVWIFRGEVLPTVAHDEETEEA